LREHIAAYLLASLTNILLLLPVSQLGAKAGHPVDLPMAVALHQLLVAVLVFLLTVSGMIRRGWRWQYAASGMLFSAYVGYRMASRFLAGLESISFLQSQNVSTSNELLMLYWYGLAAAASYFGTILAVRRAYGKITAARTVGLGA
jgi:hypothetical protein